MTLIDGHQKAARNYINTFQSIDLQGKSFDELVRLAERGERLLDGAQGEDYESFSTDKRRSFQTTREILDLHHTVVAEISVRAQQRLQGLDQMTKVLGSSEFSDEYQLEMLIRLSNTGDVEHALQTAAGFHDREATRWADMAINDVMNPDAAHEFLLKNKETKKHLRRQRQRLAKTKEANNDKMREVYGRIRENERIRQNEEDQKVGEEEFKAGLKKLGDPESIEHPSNDTGAQLEAYIYSYEEDSFLRNLRGITENADLESINRLLEEAERLRGSCAGLREDSQSVENLERLDSYIKEFEGRQVYASASDASLQHGPPVFNHADLYHYMIDLDKMLQQKSVEQAVADQDEAYLNTISLYVDAFDDFTDTQIRRISDREVRGVLFKEDSGRREEYERINNDYDTLRTKVWIALQEKATNEILEEVAEEAAEEVAAEEVVAEEVVVAAEAAEAEESPSTVPLETPLQRVGDTQDFKVRFEEYFRKTRGEGNIVPQLEAAKRRGRRSEIWGLIDEVETLREAIKDQIENGNEDIVQNIFQEVIGHQGVTVENVFDKLGEDWIELQIYQKYAQDDWLKNLPVILERNKFNNVEIELDNLLGVDNGLLERDYNQYIKQRELAVSNLIEAGDRAQLVLVSGYMRSLHQFADRDMAAMQQNNDIDQEWIDTYQDIQKVNNVLSQKINQALAEELEIEVPLSTYIDQLIINNTRTPYVEQYADVARNGDRRGEDLDASTTSGSPDDFTPAPEDEEAPLIRVGNVKIYNESDYDLLVGGYKQTASLQSLSELVKSGKKHVLQNLKDALRAICQYQLLRHQDDEQAQAEIIERYKVSHRQLEKNIKEARFFHGKSGLSFILPRGARRAFISLDNADRAMCLVDPTMVLETEEPVLEEASDIDGTVVDAADPLPSDSAGLAQDMTPDVPEDGPQPIVRTNKYVIWNKEDYLLLCNEYLSGVSEENIAELVRNNDQEALQDLRDKMAAIYGYDLLTKPEEREKIKAHYERHDAHIKYNMRWTWFLNARYIPASVKNFFAREAGHSDFLKKEGAQSANAHSAVFENHAAVDGGTNGNGLEDVPDVSLEFANYAGVGLDGDGNVPVHDVDLTINDELDNRLDG